MKRKRGTFLFDFTVSDMTFSAKPNGIYININFLITLRLIIALLLTMSIITKTNGESYAHNFNKSQHLNEAERQISRSPDHSVRISKNRINERGEHGIYLNTRKHPAIWATWSWWSSCSRTCGHGVRMRSRTCLLWYKNNYIKTPLSSCPDTNIDFHICKDKDCSENVEDFRDYQCSLYNQPRRPLSYGGKWKPVFTEKTPCRLICESTKYPIQKSFGSVLDGTFCYRQGTDMCVHGECKKHGCDNHLNSRQKIDMCGICGGQNDTCQKIEGTYTERLPIQKDGNIGYNEMFVLPIGATELHIHENTRNYLALMSANKTFELNGNYKIESSRRKQIAGTEVFYKRGRGKNESLRIVGPTKEKIFVLLLYKEHNKGVKYEYWMPNKSSREKYKTYEPIIRENLIKDHRNHLERSRSQKIKNIHSRIKKYYRTSTATNTSLQFERRTPFLNKAGIRNHYLKKAAGRYFNDGRNISSESSTSYWKKKNNKGPTKCIPCRRTKKRKELFCQGAFVSHIRVISKSILKNQVRYDVTMRRLYRYTIPLMAREFIWLQKGCQCPKLVEKKEYLVIGFVNPHHRREIQLILPPDTYFRTYTNFAAKKLEDLSTKHRCSNNQKH